MSDEIQQMQRDATADTTAAEVQTLPTTPTTPTTPTMPPTPPSAPERGWKWFQRLFAVTVGSGNVATEQRAVSDFNEVVLSGIGQLRITQTGSESLTIEAEDNILPLLTTVVDGRRLKLGTAPGAHIVPRKPIRYTLTVKGLALVRLSGAGSIEIPALNTQALRLEISGAGSLQVTGLAAETAELLLSGAGNATCAGEVRDQTIRISGAGSYHGEDLASVRAQATISGSGSAYLHVSEQLDARVSGMGSIIYSGAPSVHRTVTGMGRVSQRA